METQDNKEGEPASSLKYRTSRPVAQNRPMRPSATFSVPKPESPSSKALAGDDKSNKLAHRFGQRLGRGAGYFSAALASKWNWLFRTPLQSLKPTTETPVLTRALRPLDYFLLLLLCTSFLYVFRQFAQNGRYETAGQGTILDTRNGAVYRRNVDGSTKMELLNEHVSPIEEQAQNEE